MLDLASSDDKLGLNVHLQGVSFIVEGLRCEAADNLRNEVSFVSNFMKFLAEHCSLLAPAEDREGDMCGVLHCGVAEHSLKCIARQPPRMRSLSHEDGDVLPEKMMAAGVRLSLMQQSKSQARPRGIPSRKAFFKCHPPRNVPPIPPQLVLNVRARFPERLADLVGYRPLMLPGFRPLMLPGLVWSPALLSGFAGLLGYSEVQRNRGVVLCRGVLCRVYCSTGQVV